LNSANNVIYGFNSKGGSDITLSSENDYFRVNQETGVVTVKGVLDHEVSRRELLYNIVFLFDLYMGAGMRIKILKDKWKIGHIVKLSKYILTL